MTVQMIAIPRGNTGPPGFTPGKQYMSRTRTPKLMTFKTPQPGTPIDASRTGTSIAPSLHQGDREGASTISNNYKYMRYVVSLEECAKGICLCNLLQLTQPNDWETVIEG